MNSIIRLRSYVERFGFGVCRYIGGKIGIQTSRIRLYFIYLSFITFGSPIVIYLFIAFWINIKKYLRKSLNIISD
jgi:phage shock protein PspC (stress-responsive transcriptional regulator)